MNVSDLYVIAPISNPVRYVTRYKLFREFEARMLQQGINLWTVELAFGNRPFEVTTTGNPKHLQLRTQEELWHKENMINLAIARLPTDWKYAAWVDTDISFMNPDWAMETIQQLQHYPVVQMWQTAIDLGPKGDAINQFNSAVWCYQNGKPYMTAQPGTYYGPSKNKFYFHPGFSWGITKQAYNLIGGIPDRMILGASDHHFCLCVLGMGKYSIPTGMTKAYTDYVMHFEDLCDKNIRKNVGYVPGTISHHWHGKKADRKYWDRWQVLRKGQFDPYKDLKKDWQGLYQLVDDGTERSIILRDGIRNYFRGRSEDSIDL